MDTHCSGEQVLDTHVFDGQVMDTQVNTGASVVKDDDLAITNAHLAVLGSAVPAGADSLVVRGGVIDWVGAAGEGFDHAASGLPVADCGGRLLTPGLVDCHTHLIFAGQRCGEFEQRLEGASYADISRAGGGIAATVRATRAASHEKLLDTAAARLAVLSASGVTTVEIKSGYGLDRDTELKMLRVARELGASGPLNVVTSYLGAHALPPEFADDRDGYLDLICNEVLRGATANAARALGLHERGELAPGKRADLALWDVGSSAELVQPMGAQPLAALLIDGRCIRGALQ